MEGGGGGGDLGLPGTTPERRLIFMYVEYILYTGQENNIIILLQGIKGVWVGLMGIVVGTLWVPSG